MPHDTEVRQQIAALLTHRCNNCYQRLPGAEGCNVRSKGWNWVTPDFGPFCDECLNEMYRGIVHASNTDGGSRHGYSQSRIDSR